MSKGGNFKCHCSGFPATNSEVSYDIDRLLAAATCTVRKKGVLINAALAKINKGNFSRMKRGQMSSLAIPLRGKCPLLPFLMGGQIFVRSPSS